ncbi:MAG TPA: anti-sigma factor [Acidimicrobiia bacterium]|nr:anti-sigma factor [Acidimicrobiia bacterium]
MDRELSPEEINDLLAAYAIDAVDDDERRAIDEYLAGDPDARAQVGELQHAASYLGHSGGPPPPGVWERLESVIHDAGDPAAPPPPRLVPGARRPARPSRGWPIAAVAASIVALVFGALLVFGTGDDSGGSTSTAALAQAAVRADGARQANLVDHEGKVLARAVVLPDGRGYLTSSLPALPAGRTYQLWGINPQDTVSLGVMGRDPGVVAFQAADHPRTLAVTEERAGGVPVTANQPTAAGDLTA